MKKKKAGENLNKRKYPLFDNKSTWGSSYSEITQQTIDSKLLIEFSKPFTPSKFERRKKETHRTRFWWIVSGNFSLLAFLPLFYIDQNNRPNGNIEWASGEIGKCDGVQVKIENYKK